MSPPSLRVSDGHGDLPDPRGSPEPLSHFQSTFESNSISGKRFKACRVCRKHKLKCERKDDATCQRCHDNGVRCLYDIIGSRRRDTPGQRHDSRPRNYVTPLGLKSPIQSVHPRNSQPSIVNPDKPHSTILHPSQPLFLVTDHMPMRQPSELTSQDLRAPVSAMHNLSQNEESRHHSSSSTDTTSCTDQTQRKASGILFGRNVKQKDMVSKGIIDHQQARQLFTSFIANATNFLPIFDPILDSFEALRFREPFCFGVILTLACCIDGLLQREECLEEIKALVAGTLFDCPATIGTVQGMMLLVVYAENTWFAIGHALQIAQDLKLDQILPNQQVQNQSGVSENIGQQRRTMRNARVWLALCLIEREVAIGTARSCRIPKIPAADLTYFTHQSLTHPPNMRFASLVEAVQVRDEFLSEITEAGDLQDTGLRRLNHMESKFEEWLQNWDAHHRDYGYDISSFQRTGLRGQKNYALIFLGCATISKISGNRQLSRAVKDSSGTLPRTVDFVMAIALKQLQLILESESYRWHLKWATNYTVLSLTFTCIFALEMSKHRDDLNAPKVLTTVRGIAAILAGYHDPFFYQLIQARLSHHPGASSYMIPEQSSQNQAGVCHNSKTRSAQCETASAAVCSTQFQLPHSSLRQSLLPDMDFTPQSPLSQLLETPDWMLNPSSMLVFDANDWQNNDTSDVNY